MTLGRNNKKPSRICTVRWILQEYYSYFAALMKMRFAHYFLCLAPAVFLACGSIKEPDFRDIENIRISRFGFNESTLTLDLHYFNPNKFQLRLKSAGGDIWIENNFLGHFTMDTLVQIPANAEFRLPVKLQVDMSKIFKNSMVALLAKEVIVKVEGTARVGKGFIFINYPIQYEGKQNLGEMLK